MLTLTCNIHAIDRHGLRIVARKMKVSIYILIVFIYFAGAAPMKTPPVYKRPLPVFHHNSLPRKTNFQRNTPVRRSMGAEPLVEYFVPRSVSEFDLSIAGDIPLFTNRIGTHQTMPNPKNNKVSFLCVYFIIIPLNKSDLSHMLGIYRINQMYTLMLKF